MKDRRDFIITVFINYYFQKCTIYILKNIFFILFLHLFEEYAIMRKAKNNMEKIQCIELILESPFFEIVVRRQSC